METYYRGRSRVIAIIDIIWSSLGLGSTVLNFFSLAVLSQAERGRFKNTQPNEHVDDELHSAEDAPHNDPFGGFERSNKATVQYITNVMLGAVMLSMVITTTQLVAAIRLLKACDLQTESVKALKGCRFWCGMTIFFIVVLGLHLFSTGKVSPPGQIFALFQIMFRLYGLYYVSEFIKEVTHPVLPVACDIFAPPPEPLRGFYPKPSPPPPYPQDESPPPYHASEAPPPYEHAPPKP